MYVFSALSVADIVFDRVLIADKENEVVALCVFDVRALAEIVAVLNIVFVIFADPVIVIDDVLVFDTNEEPDIDEETVDVFETVDEPDKVGVLRMLILDLADNVDAALLVEDDDDDGVKLKTAVDVDCLLIELVAVFVTVIVYGNEYVFVIETVLEICELTVLEPVSVAVFVLTDENDCVLEVIDDIDILLDLDCVI